MLEQRVAALEGGVAALAVGSGHAAQHLALYTLLSPGDEVVAARQLYGGTVNQFNHAFKKFGWGVKWADATKPETFKHTAKLVLPFELRHSLVIRVSSLGIRLFHSIVNVQEPHVAP